MHSDKKHVLYRLLNRARGILRLVDPTLDIRALLDVVLPFFKYIIKGISDDQLQLSILEQQKLDLDNDPEVDILYVN